MTLERDLIIETESIPGTRRDPVAASNEARSRRLDGPSLADAALLDSPPARTATYRFMKSALRRRRRVWLGLAVLGLVGGVAVSAFFPPKYVASATLYLAYPTGTDSAVASQNDLAMLDTTAVGQRALAHLGIHRLAPLQLLGKAPGQLTSNDVLTISISGPSPHQAIARVDAVAHAFLAFRAHQYDAQHRAVAASARSQIARLTTEVKALTGRIATLRATGGAGQNLTTLVDQRAADTAQITTLEQAVQQATLSSTEVNGGSRIITPGTVLPRSKSTALLRNGLTGLVVGLAVGIGGVLTYELLSDRLRRRDEIAAVLGSPVDLSVPRVPWALVRRRSAAALATTRPVPVRMLEQHLKEYLERVSSTVLIVAIDDARIPAAAVAVLCHSLCAAGHEVVAVDTSDRLLLARTLDSPATGARTLDVGGPSAVTLIVPGAPWDEDASPTVPPGADAALVLATLDLRYGAAHLLAWSSEAIVTVRAGGATAERIDAASRLLRSAGITVSSAVLLNADEGDESIGIPEGGPAIADRPAAPFTAAMQL